MDKTTKTWRDEGQMKVKLLVAVVSYGMHYASLSTCFGNTVPSSMQSKNIRLTIISIKVVLQSNIV